MEKNFEQKEIELRSEEFQEIVKQSPRWMIRSGISLIFGLLILLIVGSYFFRYPDVIKTNIVVYSENQLSKGDSLSASDLQKVFGKETQIAGRIMLPLKEARKVAVGQKINIRLEDYPYMEYGYLKGSVKSISQILNNRNYIVEVEMPQNMTTNYNVPLKFSQGMKGSAEIITEDLRLIQRFVNPVKSLLKHRISHPE